MSSTRLSGSLSKAAVIVALGLCSCPISAADTPNSLYLTLDVPDTLVKTGQEHTLLNIYLDNYYHEVFGFQFVLVSERPDLVTFNFDHGGVDTASTLTSGWEWVEATDRAGDQSETWFRCIADLFWIEGDVPGFAPQQGGVAVRIAYNTTNAPDTNLDLTSIIRVATPVDFSDPWGYSIGVVTDTIYDTSFFMCQQWVNDECLVWMEIDSGALGYDSIYVDTVRYGYLDTTLVSIRDGSITLKLTPCDQDGSGAIEISDLLCLVEYMFGTFNPIACPLLNCDANGNGELEVSDLLILVEYMFNNGPAPF